jgi:NADH-quinone oxidoreductase subunit A
LKEYLSVLVYLLLAAGLGVGLLVLSYYLGPRRKAPVKESPYESGVDPIGDARIPFNVRFYLVGILFIVFDVEAVFLYVWAVIYRQHLSQGAFLLAEMALFIGILLFGYVYAWKKGALDWD